MRGPLRSTCFRTFFVCAIAAILSARSAPFAFAQASSADPTPQLAGEPAAADKVGKTLQALRITGTPPAIDGRLDDEVWLAAQKIEDLVQNEPANMEAPSERTTIQIAFDDRYIYVAAHCYMADPSQIVAPLARRDTFPPSDMLRLSFDPRHDHSTAYVFHTNPAGVQMDDSFVDDTRFSPDFDAVWEVKTAITDEGWNAEFRIPFSQLRFSLEPGQVAMWGFNVRRDIYRKGEFDRWVATPRGAQGLVSRFGHLTFDERLAPPRRIEVLPYITGRRDQQVGVDAEHEFEGGVDARLGIGTASTLSATINPDFGQVEQDPAVLNLSVFETFFPEKRPFFLEDSRIFVLPYGQFPLFHSRRIGQRPARYALQEGDTLVSRPDQTTILGAGKFTGKKGAWTYGGISALTAAEYAIVDATTTDNFGQTETERLKRLIEPRTSYNVGRVRRDLFQGRSNVGLIGTTVLRDNDLDAHTGGGDYMLRWKENKLTFQGHWAGTHAPVSGTVRNGWGGASEFFYSGKHFDFNTHVDHFSRYFRNADLGYLSSRPNKTATNMFVGVKQPDPTKYFRSFGQFFGGGGEFNDEVTLNQFINTGQDLQFHNFWYFGWNIGHNFDAMDDLDTRGGPPIVRPSSNWLNLFVNSDSRKTYRYGFNLGISRDRVDSENNRVGGYLNLQPMSQLQLQFNWSYTDGRNDAQWIATEDADADGNIDYIYGTLDRNVIDVTTRATYSFTRNLTLQTFLQPFVAVGDYTNIRELAAPRSYDFQPIEYASNPDFNNKSLRMNTVLRWEYRPGSTLFLAWNRNGSDGARPGVFSPWDDFRGAFGADGNHVFMVKMNYWLGL